MTTKKLIYVSISGRNEEIELRTDDSVDDVTEVFRGAAEASSNDLLKLYSIQGKVLNISADLKPNTPDTRYKLDVVAVPCTGSSVGQTLGFDIGRLERKLEGLEKKMLLGTEEMEMVSRMRKQMDAMIEKLTESTRLSWLGLSKTGDHIELDYISPHGFPKVPPSKIDNEERCQNVFKKFRQYSEVQTTKEIRDLLKRPTFDNWQWEDHEMMILIRHMFTELGLHTTFHLEMPIFNEWICEVYRRYKSVPFHNFKHCFMVTQMTYGLIWLIELQQYLQDFDLLVLLIGAICHDIDHPGFNNAYQINLRTELALRYNDISPLENHHCATAFEILRMPGCNVLRNLSVEQFKRFRESVIRCILATDMARHNELHKAFKAIIPVFDVNEKEHKDVLLSIIIKVSDISNEARPMDVAMPWLDALFKEFSNQFRSERENGIAMTPFMDLEKVNKPSSQVGFIKFVLLPLYQSLGELFPAVIPDLVIPVKKALDYWVEMEHSLVVEKQRKEIEINQLSATPSNIMINVMRSR